MSRRCIGALVSLSAWLMAAHASAQTTRTEQITDEKSVKAAAVQPATPEKGDLIVTKIESIFMPAPPSIRFTLGDFRPGAGFALGAAYALTVGERGVWSTTAAWSVENFKEVESAIDFRPPSTDRIRVHAFVKSDDAPELPFYGLGTATTREDEVSYGLRSTEAGVDVQARGAHWFSYGLGASHLSVRSSDGAGPLPATGVSASPAWWHATAYAAVDWRDSSGYTTSGGLYRVAFHDYADHAGGLGFTRTEIDLRQFVPVLHDNWIIALQARADLTATADGQVIPFFMLPSIGGPDTLPGYGPYRFTDTTSLLLRSELRWTPAPVIDMAVFLDHGTVAPTAGALDFRDVKRSWGIGARLHGATFTALRLEVVHSVEGWRCNVAHSISF